LFFFSEIDQGEVCTFLKEVCSSILFSFSSFFLSFSFPFPFPFLFLSFSFLFLSFPFLSFPFLPFLSLMDSSKPFEAQLAELTAAVSALQTQVKAEREARLQAEHRSTLFEQRNNRLEQRLEQQIRARETDRQLLDSMKNQLRAQLRQEQAEESGRTRQLIERLHVENAQAQQALNLKIQQEEEARRAADCTGWLPASVVTTPLDRFGSKGVEDGQFNFPCSVSCNASGHMFVADWKPSRADLFSSGSMCLVSRCGDAEASLSPFR